MIGRLRPQGLHQLAAACTAIIPTVLLFADIRLSALYVLVSVVMLAALTLLRAAGWVFTSLRWCTAIGAASSLALSARHGGWVAVVVASCLVAAAWLHARAVQGSTSRGGVMASLAITTAFALSFLLSGLAVGPFRSTGGSGSEDYRPGDGAFGSPGWSFPPPKSLEPPRQLTWVIPWLILLLVLFVAALLIRWLLSSRRVVVPAVGHGLLRRFERVGADVGVARSTGQGVASYGTTLSELTDDDRLEVTGSALSRWLFSPRHDARSAAAAEAEQRINDLETAPPPPLPRPESTTKSRASSLFTRRRVAVVCLLGVLVLGASQIPRLEVGSFDRLSWRSVDYQTGAVDPHQPFLWEVCTRDSQGQEQHSVGVRSAEGVDYSETVQIIGEAINSTDVIGPYWARSRQWSDDDVAVDHTELSYGSTADWVTVPIERLFSHRIGELTSRETAVAFFSLGAVVPAHHVDRRGVSFERWEVAGPLNIRPPDAGPDTSSTGLLFPSRSWSVSQVVDIWADESDRVERIRILVDDRFGLGAWTELRFSPRMPADPLPGPDNGLTLGVLHDCPLDDDSDDVWLGVASFEPTLRVEPDIQLDQSGRPYDLSVPPHDLVVADLGRLGLDDEMVLIVVPPDEEWDRYPNGQAIDLGLDATLADVSTTSRFLGERQLLSSVRFDVPDTTVSRWVEVGASVSPLGSVTPLAEFDRRSTDWWNMFHLLDEEGSDDEPAMVRLDLDGDGDHETAHFPSLAYGDEVVRLVNGLDQSGRVVSVVFWLDATYWRAAHTDGTPPQFVVERERRMQACLDGRWPLTRGGQCQDVGEP